MAGMSSSAQSDDEDAAETRRLLSSRQASGPAASTSGHSAWSRLWLSWVFPLVSRGLQRTLQLDDLLSLDPQLEPERCSEELWREWSREVNRPKGRPSLLRALIRAYGSSYLLLGLVKAFSDGLNLVGPLLLNLLVTWLVQQQQQQEQHRPPEGLLLDQAASSQQQPGASGSRLGVPWRLGGLHVAALLEAVQAICGALLASMSRSSPYHGLWVAALLGATCLAKALASSAYNWQLSRLNARLRAGLMASLYRKVLLAPLAATSRGSAGGAAAPPSGSGGARGSSSSHAGDGGGSGGAPADPSTLMSVDTGRLVNLLVSGHELWSLPMQILLALYLLYLQVRFAFLAGLAISLLLIPVNRLLTSYIQVASVRMMGAKDWRMALTAQLLAGIRAVKMLCWEGVMAARLRHVRSQELRALAVRKYLDALCVYFWAATSLLFTLLTFGAVLLMGERLTPQAVFTSLALFNVLIGPLNAYPWVLNGVVEALVSGARIRAYLLLRPERKAAWAQAAAEQAQGHESSSPRGGLLSQPTAPAAAAAAAAAAGAAAAHPPFGSASGEQQSVVLYMPGLKEGIGGSSSSADSTATTTTGGPSSHAGLPSLDADLLPWAQPLAEDASVGAMFLNASFSWTQAGPLCLQGLDLILPRAKVTVVAGRTGSGKSSLLAALLGELYSAAGLLQVSARRVAYVPQQPWLLSGSVRDNILLGSPYQPALYQRVLEATALLPDLQRLEQGDATLVGDAGASLSGGQAARLALARALYQQDCDMYLLDDVLAAVDNAVAATIVTLALRGPLLAGKTVVMASNSPAVMQAADVVVQLRKGQLEFLGSRRQAAEVPAAAAAVAAAPDAQLAAAAATTTPPATAAEGTAGTEPCNRAIATADESGAGVLPAAPAPAAMDTSQEEREVGAVRWRVYAAYMRAVGGWMVAAVLASLVLMQASKTANDLWLTHWVSASASPPASGKTPSAAVSMTDASPCSSGVMGRRQCEPALSVAGCCGYALARLMRAAAGHGAEGGWWDSISTRTFLQVLITISATNAAFTLWRAFSFAWAGLSAARKMHEALLSAILAAPLAWIQSLPSGRLLNRFSSDTATIDDSLPFIMNILLANAVSLLGVLAVLCYSQPLTALLLLPLGAAYVQLQRFYRSTSREVRRLDAALLSPVYSSFAQALAAVPSIRAYAVQQPFLAAHTSAVQRYQRASISNAAASAWLGLRLQVIAAVLVALVAAIAALGPLGWLPGSDRAMSAGLTGLSLAYALPVVGLLNGLLTSSAETEQEMVAVERVQQYVLAPAQPAVLPPLPCAQQRAAAAAAAVAVIEFRCVVLTYGAGQPAALAGVSFQLHAGQWLGVCGRTGAGKSSLVNALLRLVEISGGCILLNGTDVRSIPLRQLRNMFGVVPQAPLLLQASLRDNLDPGRAHTDEELADALRAVHMWPVLLAAATSAGLAYQRPRHQQRAQRRGERQGSNKLSLADASDGLQQLLLPPADSHPALADVMSLQIGSSQLAGLSSGQQQLLCLARLILHRKDVVLLDECTSCMDAATATQMQEVVRTRLSGCTLLQIAHNLDSILDYGAVMVMEAGTVVEQGRPSELLAAGAASSRFAALHSTVV